MFSVCRIEANKRIDWILRSLAELEQAETPLSTRIDWRLDLAGFNNLGAMAKLVPDYQFVSVMVDDGCARANRAALAGFLKALHRGTEDMFAHPDESVSA